MPSIHVLSTELKNKIAAGEVVERPASVLRELFENSIDAGASRINIEVKKGGRALIRVQDNGMGMDEEDARLCIERHATSKLNSEDDLFNINTMGFRGEALPSIASVSMMTISTAPRGARSGISMEIEGGTITASRAAPATGTTIEVKDLFFNTPARKKFLKRDSTELLHIVDSLTLLALSHPEVGLTLKSNAQVTMDLPPASGIKERLTQVYGAEFMDELIHVEHTSDNFRVEAFVSSLRGLRERRTHQHIFINQRPIRDPSLSHAVYGSYEGIAPQGLHPVFFAFLGVPPSEVDFNVHPAKREVRFAHKESVYRFLRHAVSEPVRGQRLDEMVKAAIPGSAGAPDTPPGTAGEPLDPSTTETTGTHTDRDYPSHAPTPAHGIAEALQMDYRTDVQHVYLGESFVAYADSDGLVILDHHAAHERVLYEKLLKGLSPESHMLLFPRQVRLSPGEYMVILKHRDLLMDFGIEVDEFGQDTVVVRSLPPELEEGDIRGILSEAAAAAFQGDRPARTLMESVAASIACHSSIRGTRVLGREELGALLNALKQTQDPHHCPHGRPTRLHYSHADLRKAFKRA